MTWAVEWRIASSSSWAPASSSSSTEPRSGATSSSVVSPTSATPSAAAAASVGSLPAGSIASSALLRLVRLVRLLDHHCLRESKRPLVPTGREVDHSISRGSTRLHDSRHRGGASRALCAALTGGPGPVHRPLTGGAVRASSPGFHLPRLACDVDPISVSRSMRWAGLYPRRDASGTGPRVVRLELDDAEEQQQDDDQPRHAEDPEKQGNHVRLLWRASAGRRTHRRGRVRPSRMKSGSRKGRARITARVVTAEAALRSGRLHASTRT